MSKKTIHSEVNMQLIQINSWNDVTVPVVVYKKGTLEEARERFKTEYGRPCKLIYALRGQWLMKLPEKSEAEG